MNDLLQTFVTVVVSIGASTGFWTWFSNRNSKQSASTQLLMGLAHNEIIAAGMSYTARGYITKDEYEDFFKYLYEPYAKFGGNGLAERVMQEVSRLPIVGKTPPLVQVIEEKT